MSIEIKIYFSSFLFGTNLHVCEKECNVCSEPINKVFKTESYSKSVSCNLDVGNLIRKGTRPCAHTSTHNQQHTHTLSNSVCVH